MKRALSFVAVVCALATGATATSHELTVGVIQAALQKEGPRSTLERYFDCTTVGNSAYDMVAAGSDSWLAIAIELLPAADGCYSLILRSSIAEAMSVRPHKVLDLMDTVPALKGRNICLPFMSVDTSPAVHRAYLVKLEAALATVHTPRLQKARKACLSEIRKARRRLQ